ncbi:outer membrane protein assembly factor BamE [Xanthobacter dioxanivorans]|nr:outer membrane protein assembly factor BamE [Xanthobacter dioxanivorans]
MASQQMKTRQGRSGSGKGCGVRRGSALAPVALLLVGASLAGCDGANLANGTGGGLSGITRTYQRGYVLAEGALDQVPVGSSQEQVLLVLGTPSTVATVNGEAFFYISQTAQKVAFLKPEITDQKVLGIYFDKNKKVTRIAQYGMKDGKVFDFVSQTTPTSGEELSLIRQMIGLVTF